MDSTRFARITAVSGWAELPIGAIVEVAFYERAYVPGYGLEQQTVGIKVRLADERLAVIPLSSCEFVSPGEAKAWRAQQKRARSRTRRGLAE